MKILFIDIDTTRPDHLGCYGYPRNTSENIDGIAKDGVVFDQYFCTDAPCLPSRTALMSGKFGIHSGVVGHGDTACEMRIEGEGRGFKSSYNNECLPGILKNAGYKTVTISPFAERHSSWSFLAGFNEMYNTGKSGKELAEEISPVALDWLERNKQVEDWFLHVNFWDPHTPHSAPVELGDAFENEPIDSWLTEDIFKIHREALGSHTPRDMQMWGRTPQKGYPRDVGTLETLSDAKKFIDNYDMGIKYADMHVGYIIEKLKEQGIYDDMMIVVSSDHGEAMGEFGIYGEHGMADYSTMRIPMIIKYPSGKRGIVDDGLHYNIDFMPTLAELLRIPPKQSWDGRSYAKALTDGEDCGRDFLVLGQCAHVCQRAVRYLDYHYIRIYHDGFRLMDKELLYDIKKDPHQIHNLAAEKPDIVKECVYRLTNWHDDMMQTMKYDVDPLWTVMKEGGPRHAKGAQLKKYFELLEQDGRMKEIHSLEEKFSRYLDKDKK